MEKTSPFQTTSGEGQDQAPHSSFAYRLFTLTSFHCLYSSLPCAPFSHLSPYPFSPHVFTEGEEFLSWKNKGCQGWRGNRRLTLQCLNDKRWSLGDGKPFKGRTRQYFWKINSAFVYSKSFSKTLFIWMSLIYNLVIWKGTGSSLLFHYLRWKKLCSKNDQSTALGLQVIH